MAALSLHYMLLFMSLLSSILLDFFFHVLVLIIQSRSDHNAPRTAGRMYLAADAVKILGT